MNQAPFFVVCPLGLEDLLKNEIQEIAPFILSPNMHPQTSGLKKISVTKGGVELNCDLYFALQLHFFSKIASRILMRITDFYAEEFSWLEKEFKKIDFSKWIADQSVRLEVSIQRSQLGQEKRVEEVFRKAQKKINFDEQAEVCIYIRGFENQFQVSLDLSGEHLHRRANDRKLTGIAPIRETLAAALIQFMINKTPATKLASVHLFDPMAGSGTILFEAKNLYTPTRRKKYSFDLLKGMPEVLKSQVFLKNYHFLNDKPLWKELIAEDENPVAKAYLGDHFTSETKGLKTNTANSPLWLISNPPYGERLAGINTDQLLKILFKYNPNRIGLVLPQAQVNKLEKQWPSRNHWEIRKLAVSNGGIPCYFFVAEKQ